MVRIVATLIALVLFSVPAVSQSKRVALVIGNSAYQHTSKLANPKNDATDIAATLKQRGFQVVDGFDLDKAAFDRKIRDFAMALKGFDVGLFFYAGHGLQVAGQNYLVPIDAKAESTEALEFEMVRLDVVHRIMERQTSTNILFLDACRDNPLARNLARAMGTRSSDIGRGLAAVESGIGTLISFSTQPGAVALDGAGRNSPFAGALTKHIGGSSDDLGAILISVRNDVMKETQRKQVPWEHSSLTGRFYFNQNAATGPSIQPVPPASAPRQGEAAEAWAAAKDTKSIAVLEDFVARFKDTFYAGLARARIEELRREGTASASPGEGTKETGPTRQGSRDTVRDSLYQAIMHYFSQRPSSKYRGQTIAESYQGAPNPKAMAICLDWSKATPTSVASGGIAGSYTDRGNTGCKGLSVDQCSRYTLGRCHERGLCSSRGQDCVLVDRAIADSW